MILSSFFKSPHSWKPRRWLFWLHLYAGLVIGLLALVIGLSGAALVYSPEIELLQGAPVPAAHPMPLGQLVEKVLAGYPRFRLQDIRFNAAGHPVELHIQKGEKKKAPGEDLRLVVDPETGVVLKTVDWHGGVWHFLRDLHHDLLAARTGRLVNGVGALALAILCITGIVIWWPGPGRWKHRLGVKRSSNWKRFNWDLHSATGFWLAAGLAFFSFTGFQYAFPEASKGALRRITGSPARPKKPRLESVPGARMADLALLVSRAESAVPEGRLRQIKFPKKEEEPIEARVKTPFDGHVDGNNKVFLNRVTGEVVMVDRFARLSLANRAIELLEPVHNARFMSPGWTSVLVRIPWVLFGLGPGLLFMTGFLMWWNRVASKKLPASGRPVRNGWVRRWTSAVGITAVMLAAAWPLWAQQESTVAGRVLDASDAAIPDAKITLRTSPERTVRSGAAWKAR